MSLIVFFQILKMLTLVKGICESTILFKLSSFEFVPKFRVRQKRRGKHRVNERMWRG